MNIHTLIKTGLPLAPDEGADIIVVLDHDSGELVAYLGHEGNYEEEGRVETDEECEDIEDLIAEAEDFLNELVNVGGEGDAIEGEAEEV